MSTTAHSDHETGSNPQESSGAPAPKDAPGALNLVRAFVNTVDLDSGEDQFAGPPELRDWLVAHGVVAAHAKLTDADVRRAIAVREALRQLLLANNDGSRPDESAAADLTAAGTRARLATVFSADGSARLVSGADGIDAALGRLLAIVYAAMANGTWPRLKACRNDTCKWAFYDHSKNRSGHWCTMSACGSQLKARAYRQRRKETTSREG